MDDGNIAPKDTSKKETTRSDLWGTITQATDEYRHQGSGNKTIHSHAIRSSRQTTSRYMRTLWSQRGGAHAPYPKTGRPEKEGAKGKAVLDANHDSPKTKDTSGLPQVP